MRLNFQNKLKIGVLCFMALELTACGFVGHGWYEMKEGSSVTASPHGDEPVVGGELIGGGANVGAGYGAAVTGTGSLTAPTADAVVARIKNGLENRTSPTTANSNFGRTLNQVRGNLPKVTDPLKVTGFDQVEMLAYGACSDLTLTNTPIMQTVYGVQRNGTIAANSAALVNAGIRMLDQHVAGLASTGAAAGAVKTVFENLVAKVGATAGNTSTVAFMSVCIAANTAGSSMMGF
jgi:hypothetical protein